MTKGETSALCLMSLRSVTRRSDDCYRLIGSIATDTECNAEGFMVYSDVGATCVDDFHSDADVCRVGIAWVAMDSRMQ